MQHGPADVAVDQGRAHTEAGDGLGQVDGCERLARGRLRGDDGHRAHGLGQLHEQQVRAQGVEALGDELLVAVGDAGQHGEAGEAQDLVAQLRAREAVADDLDEHEQLGVDDEGDEQGQQRVALGQRRDRRAAGARRGDDVEAVGRRDAPGSGNREQRVVARLECGPAGRRRRQQRELSLDVLHLVIEGRHRLVDLAAVLRVDRGHQRVGLGPVEGGGRGRARTGGVHGDEPLAARADRDAVVGLVPADVEARVLGRVGDDGIGLPQGGVAAGEEQRRVLVRGRGRCVAAGDELYDATGPVDVGSAGADEVHGQRDQEGDAEHGPLPAPDDTEVLGHIHGAPG